MPISISVETNNKRYIGNFGTTQLKAESKKDLEQIVEEIRLFQIEVSKDALRDELGRGFDRRYLIIVDGKPASREEQVKRFGKIEYVARQDYKAVFLNAYRGILKRSKVVSGLYQSYNYVLFNKKIIAKDYLELEKFLASPEGVFLPGDKITFVNITPYANKLELLGISAGRSSRKVGKSRDKKLRSGPVVRKPNGVYALSYRAINRILNKIARVKFEILPADYLGFTTPIPPNGKQRFRATYDPNGAFNPGYYLLPSITVTILKDRGSLSLL